MRSRRKTENREIEGKRKESWNEAIGNGSGWKEGAYERVTHWKKWENMQRLNMHLLLPSFLPRTYLHGRPDGEYLVGKYPTAYPSFLYCFAPLYLRSPIKGGNALNAAFRKREDRRLPYKKRKGVYYPFSFALFIVSKNFSIRMRTI